MKGTVDIPRVLTARRRVAPRFLFGILLVTFVSLCGWILVWGFLLFSDANELRQSSAKAFQHVGERNLGSLHAVLPRLHGSLERVRRDIRALRVITWMPLLDAERRNAEHLLAKAEVLLDAADLGFAVTDDLQTALSSVTSYERLQPEDLARARGIVESYTKRMEELAKNAGDLLAQPTSASRLSALNRAQTKIAEPLATAQRLATLWSTGERELFRLLGTGNDRRYLLLFQNADEIRPGGGLISMYGILTLKDGQVVDLFLEHVSRIYARGTNPPSPAPEPIRKLVWPTENLPNMNWAADPSDWLARAYAFWDATDPRTVDGVIVLGTPVLEDLVRLYGPLQLPGFPGEYTAESVVSSMDFITIGEYERRHGAPESFAVLRVLVETLLARIRSTPVEKLESLVTIFSKRAAARDLYFFSPDPKERTILRLLGLGNAVPVPAGDELFLVDANLGSAKADALLERSLALDVDVRDPQRPRSRATVVYDFTRARPDPRTWPYRGYLRLLVPKTSVLRRFTGGQERPETGEEADRSLFANFVYVNFGERQEVIVDYDLPRSIGEKLQQGTYHLILRKQGGIEPPYAVTVLLPSNWSSLTAGASAGTVTNDMEEGYPRVSWKGSLEEDVTLTVSRILPP